jgi:hypothetical protein
MTLADHIKILGVTILVISALILIGLNYMVYVESKGKKSASEVSLAKLLVWDAILTVATILIMVMAPRSFLFQ